MIITSKAAYNQRFERLFYVMFFYKYITSFIGKDEVTSSNLVISSRKHSGNRVFFCCVKTAETLMFNGAEKNVSVPIINERELGAQALRRLSGFEGRIFFCRLSVLGTVA